MLNTVFYYVLNMSIASCFAISALLLIRQIRPLPRRIIYPLWSLAFFRLVIPFTISTGWSFFNFTGGLVKRLIPVESITQGMMPDSGLLAMNIIGAAESYSPLEYKTEALQQIFNTASLIWAIIALAALMTVIILYMLTRKELKKAILIKDNLYRSDVLLSPILTGVFRPKIILPVTLDPDSAEGQMILTHENTHRRRLDNLWRFIAICVSCLHWFNPLAWVMLKAFFTDMELSCDESVIKTYSSEERKAYAGTLLRFAEDKRLLIIAAFGRSGVKVRIANVLNYKKLALIGAVASALFLLAIALVFITNPQLRG